MKCPICRKQVARNGAFMPFCSERCKLQDLAHWADGTYRVAAEPVNPASDADDEDTTT